MLLILPNILSLLRFPLAFIFLQEDPLWRGVALVLAMISDGLDGFLARRYSATSRLGTIIDPIADKFFVVFVLAVFIHEQQLAIWQAMTMLSRDVAILLFSVCLFFQGHFKKFRCHAIWYGKLMTTLQLLVLLALTFHVTIPLAIFFVFIALGVLSFLELYMTVEKHLIK